MNILRRLLVAFGLVAGLPLALAAQPYPERVIKVIVPFPAGSTTDGVGRMLAEELRKSLGQPVVIENQPGADGVLAAQNVKRSVPDGYTLFMSTNSAHGVNPHIYSQLPYDPEKDFEPIGGLIRIPVVLCVRKDFPADDLASFVKIAKERTPTLSFGSGNTSSRVAAELLKMSARVELLHVPYRGSPQALQDLLGGRIDMFFSDTSTAGALVIDGRLKILGVADNVRVPLLPDVPTMAEAGYKNVEVVSWVALFAPAKTDQAIVDRLNKEINAFLAKPETKEHFRRAGMAAMPTTPNELRSFVTSEIARWGRLVEIAGIPKN
jgi:tripartite-type tricarboxylate transporter receptor subunit TctC